MIINDKNLSRTRRFPLLRRSGLVALALILSRSLSASPDLPTEIEEDRIPATRTGGNVLIQNGTLLTVSHGTLENASILIRDGKIVAIGKDIPAPDDVTIIDATGLTVMPGIIDCHSHIAIDGGVNEGTLSVTAEVRIGDVVDPDSISVYRALAGGKTLANLLHGSANTIGGQNAVVKMKYRRPVDELFFGAPRGIKFALGENVKQSNFEQARGQRFPNTRPGVEATLRRALTEAREYMLEWEDYARQKAAGKSVLEPRRDLRLETLAGVIKGEVLVHCHCYRADEILMLLRVAEEFGFRIASLQHVLEGYKVAPEIAAHGAGPSTFSDWWAYKIEAYDATPYNTALMTHAGCRVSINSDSAELDRHLYMEAAKTMRYGGLSEAEALATITLNPAWQLGIEDQVGSLDVGKDADIALFDGHPFSVYTVPMMTLVEGEVFFERKAARRDTHPGQGFTPTARTSHPPPPVTSPSSTYAIVGATIHPVTSDTIARGTIVLEGGVITALGPENAIQVPNRATVVDGQGLDVYPGLIDSGTSLGLNEIGSVAGTQDGREIGEIQADLRAIAAVNADSAHLRVTRSNGITTALTSPQGGLIAGQASLIHLDGWTQEEMSVLGEAGLTINVPSTRRGRRFGRRGGGPEPPPVNERMGKIEEAFKEARRYGELVLARQKAGAPAPPHDVQAEALLPYARKEKPVLFRADRKAEILAALDLAEKLDVRAILVGCTEGWKVADKIAEKNVPVVVGPVLTTPGEATDPYDAPYRNAAVLHEAGVTFAFQSADSSNARNLPFHAGTAVAFGLPREIALEAMTIRPARIFGVDDRIGSLEKGKVADLIVCSGDPLEVTSQVVHAFIAGRPIDLANRHTELYDRYSHRLPAGPDAEPAARPASPAASPVGAAPAPSESESGPDSVPTGSGNR